MYYENTGDRKPHYKIPSEMSSWTRNDEVVVYSPSPQPPQFITILLSFRIPTYAMKKYDLIP